MKIVLLSHPPFLGQFSMQRYAKMLLTGLTARGHEVEILSPSPVFSKFAKRGALKKWLGYIDQYIIFPMRLHWYARRAPATTLYVVTDHALGPWVPYLTDYFHIVHCHDFLAQRSALGQISENQTGWSGRIYQSYIRRGYTRAKNFISVSEKTRVDLHEFLGRTPRISEVVYNAIDSAYRPTERKEARAKIAKKFGAEMSDGYIMHIGGNQWYKNRVSVVRIYNAWRSATTSKLPLLLIGEAPDADLVAEYSESKYRIDIRFESNLDDETIKEAYSGAVVLLFPSLAEGFGWPIAEAMACGCPVITTAEQPMTEVGGDAALYIPRMPSSESDTNDWCIEVSRVVDRVVNLSDEERKDVVKRGYANVSRFDLDNMIDKMEGIYASCLRPS